MAYTNSSLVSYTKLSPNHSGQRTHSIDRITPHCVVGQLSAESICGCFTSPSRQASCNYGIGTDGRISLSLQNLSVSHFYLHQTLTSTPESSIFFLPGASVQFPFAAEMRCPTYFTSSPASS